MVETPVPSLSRPTKHSHFLWYLASQNAECDRTNNTQHNGTGHRPTNLLVFRKTRIRVRPLHSTKGTSCKLSPSFEIPSDTNDLQDRWPVFLARIIGVASNFPNSVVDVGSDRVGDPQQPFFRFPARLRALRFCAAWVEIPQTRKQE